MSGPGPVALPFAVVPPPSLNDVGGRYGHTIIFDPVRQRFLLFGGYNGVQNFNQVWERPLLGISDWTAVGTTGIQPPARREHAAVYDPIGDRMLIFGGQGNTPLSDVWYLSLSGTATWHSLLPTGTAPAARFGHTAVMDVARNRMIVFGGRTPTNSSETWVLALSGGGAAWSRPTIGGTPPPARYEHVAIVDETHDQMVIYSGVGTAILGDVWTLPLATMAIWTRRASSLGDRQAAGAVYDGAANRMLVYGGNSAEGLRGEWWELGLSTYSWGPITTSTPIPAARRDMAVAIDPVSRRVVIQGGTPASVALSDTWLLELANGNTYTQLSPALDLFTVQGNQRFAAAGAFDPASQRFFLVAGASAVGDPYNFLNDFQELVVGRDSTWVRPTAFGSAFSRRYGHSIIFDPVRNRLVMFGGYGGTYLQDVWEISLGSYIIFSPLSAAGTPPPIRDFHSAIYDPIRDRMIVFGGNDAGIYKNDLWALNLSPTLTWELLTASGTRPSQRLGHAAVYDGIADRMLVFGGYDTGSLDDVWSLSLSGAPAWSKLAPVGPLPTGRQGHQLAFDPTRNRLILFGGVNQASGIAFNDLWELPMSGALAWHVLSPSGAIPAARYSHLAILDPVSDRMIVTGGFGGGEVQRSSYRLQWGPVGSPGTELEFAL